MFHPTALLQLLHWPQVFLLIADLITERHTNDFCKYTTDAHWFQLQLIQLLGFLTREAPYAATVYLQTFIGCCFHKLRQH